MESKIAINVGLVWMLVIFLVSCGRGNDTTVKSDGDNYEYHVEVIEGCEYIYKSGGYHFGIAHKGNCINPIHKN